MSSSRKSKKDGNAPHESDRKLSVAAQFMTRDLDLLNFETKVRGLMGELISPMVER